MFICLHWVLVTACGIEFPDRESHLGPLPWECGVLATGPSGKSLFLGLKKNYFYLLAMQCGMWNFIKFPNQGMNQNSLHWKHGILTTWPPWKSQEFSPWWHNWASGRMLGVSMNQPEIVGELYMWIFLGNRNSNSFTERTTFIHKRDLKETKWWKAHNRGRGKWRGKIRRPWLATPL